MVESHVANVIVAGSNPVTRSNEVNQKEYMPKKRQSPTIYKKSLQKQWKQRIADDIYDAQLEDLEHLLKKKKRLKRKELFTHGIPK